MYWYSNNMTDFFRKVTKKQTHINTDTHIHKYVCTYMQKKKERLFDLFIQEKEIRSIPKSASVEQVSKLRNTYKMEKKIGGKNCKHVYYLPIVYT